MSIATGTRIGAFGRPVSSSNTPANRSSGVRLVYLIQEDIVPGIRIVPVLLFTPAQKLFDIAEQEGESKLITCY